MPRLPDLDAFITALKPRLERGAREYGDCSFDRPVDELLCEIEDELLDVCGWSVILYTRLQCLKGRVHG
jgi:hypothetical protein